MKAKNKKTNSYDRLEKVLALAGLILIIVGCVASLYGAYTNLRFIQDSLDFIYYSRYAILLGGGFAAGYLLAKKEATRSNRLFTGVSYAVLATTLCWVFDLVRVSFQGLTDDLPFPLGKIVFMGIPLLSLIAILIIAYVSQYRKTNHTGLSTPVKITMISSFTVYHVYMLASDIYFTSTGAATYSPNTSIWLMIGSYLITPLSIAIVSYLLLNKIDKRLNRLFYAALIGALYSIFTLVLWEFRTDPAYEATNIFGNIVAALSIVFTGVLLWRARKAIR